MKHLASVVEKDNRNSYWVARVPENLVKIGWEAQITCDEPGKLISWKSLKGSTVDNEGRLSFLDTPEEKGTIINAVISYKLTVNGTGEGLAKLFTPIFEKLIQNDIENFKTYIESGQVSPNPHEGGIALALPFLEYSYSFHFSVLPPSPFRED